MFKPFINDLSTFKEQQVGGYLNVLFLSQIMRLSNIIMKKYTQHIKYGKIIQRSTWTIFR